MGKGGKRTFIPLLQLRHCPNVSTSVRWSLRLHLHRESMNRCWLFRWFGLCPCLRAPAHKGICHYWMEYDSDSGRVCLAWTPAKVCLFIGRTILQYATIWIVSLANTQSYYAKSPLGRIASRLIIRTTGLGETLTRVHLWRKLDRVPNQKYAGGGWLAARLSNALIVLSVNAWAAYHVTRPWFFRGKWMRNNLYCSSHKAYIEYRPAKQVDQVGSKISDPNKLVHFHAIQT